MSTTDETTTPALADVPRLDVREDRPVVNVRDGNLWAHDPRTSAMLTELREHDVDTDPIYEGIVRDFWDHYAPEAARSVGYSGTVYSAGRSSGWIYPDDAPDFLSELSEDDPWSQTSELTVDTGQALCDVSTAEALRDRDQFLRFAAAIKGAVEMCEQEFVDALGEAVRDLRERQEAAIVRGEN